MDLGKATIMIPTDVMQFGEVELLADSIAAGLRKDAYGEVLAVAKLRYEPFTPHVHEFGWIWNEITINLDKVIGLDELKELLTAAGVPNSAHLTYSDQMRMCGESLAGSDNSFKPNRLPRGPYR